MKTHRFTLLAALFGASALAWEPAVSRAAVVVGLNGNSVSVYANPFDPNLDYTGTGTTVFYGDPSTGTAGAWQINPTNEPIKAVNRRDDGRTYFNADSSAWIYNTSNTNGPPAFLQYTAQSTFTVGTIITGHSTGNAAITQATPYDLRFSTGSPGTTGAAWSAVTPTTAGPGTINRYPITVVTPGFNTFTADTMRISYSQTTKVTSNGESDAMMAEVAILPDRRYPLATTVSGFSADNTGIGGAAGVNDGQGGTNSTNAGIWYDITGNPITSKFVELTITGGPRKVAGVVFFSDQIHQQALNIRKDGAGGQLVASVTFNPSIGEVLPIRFDTPITTSVLRFEWTAGGSATEGTLGWAAMREIVVLDLPEPGSATAILTLCGAVALRRPKRSIA